MPSTTAQDIITDLGMVAHEEGGYYAPSYKAEDMVPTPDLPGGERSRLSCIYYMLTRDR